MKISPQLQKQTAHIINIAKEMVYQEKENVN